MGVSAYMDEMWILCHSSSHIIETQNRAVTVMERMFSMLSRLGEMKLAKEVSRKTKLADSRRSTVLMLRDRLEPKGEMET
jgi:hypothetical protein